MITNEAKIARAPSCDHDVFKNCFVIEQYWLAASDKDSWFAHLDVFGIEKLIDCSSAGTDYFSLTFQGM